MSKTNLPRVIWGIGPYITGETEVFREVEEIRAHVAQTLLANSMRVCAL